MKKISNAAAACLMVCLIAFANVTAYANEKETASAVSIQAKNKYVFYRNSKATISIVGKPNTEYRITVYYDSGPSKAKGLEKKTSDSKGRVSWTWKIGGKTKAGTYKVIFKGGGEEITKKITIKAE